MAAFLLWYTDGVSPCCDGSDMLLVVSGRTCKTKCLESGTCLGGDPREPVLLCALWNSMSA